MSAATASPSSWSTSATTTAAPSLANNLASAAPIPCAPPVMIATLSFSLMFFSLVDEHDPSVGCGCIRSVGRLHVEQERCVRRLAPPKCCRRNPQHEAYHAIGDGGVHADEPRDLRAASGCNDSRGGG